jgi:hypothetical protein
VKEEFEERRRTMKGLVRKIEAWMGAVAFAESGEHEMALQMLGSEITRQKRASWNNIMVAIAFAEAGLHDVARQYYLGAAPSARSVEHNAVPGVKVWYGTATVAP